MTIISIYNFFSYSTYAFLFIYIVEIVVKKPPESCHIFKKLYTLKLLLQRIFLTQGWNFWVSCIAGRFFTVWAMSSVQFSFSVVSDSLRPHELQHARPPCPSPTPGVHPNPRSLSQWCHPAISSSVIPFSSCPQFLPASGSFPKSQLFAWGGQSTGVSASASFLPKKSQGWSPSEWTGWISLQSKGLSRVFSNTTVQKHQFFGSQPYLWSHIHTWP